MVPLLFHTLTHSAGPANTVLPCLSLLQFPPCPIPSPGAGRYQRDETSTARESRAAREENGRGRMHPEGWTGGITLVTHEGEPLCQNKPQPHWHGNTNHIAPGSCLDREVAQVEQRGAELGLTAPRLFPGAAHLPTQAAPVTQRGCSRGQPARRAVM